MPGLDTLSAGKDGYERSQYYVKTPGGAEAPMSEPAKILGSGSALSAQRSALSAQRSNVPQISLG
jgi:hypothetical protein